MGRKNDDWMTGGDEYDDDNEHDGNVLGIRKHKKHKRKHRHKKSEINELDERCEEELTSPRASIKLRLKLGGETLINKNVKPMGHTVCSEFGPDDAVIDVTDDVSLDCNSLSAAESSNAASVIEDSVVLDTRSKKNSSDEESQWLDALEAGTLDDFGELPPKNRDHSHLTARQRAMLHGPQIELQQLPSGYKNVVLTEEQKEIRQVRATKRRQQAYEKCQNDKKQTLDRLLYKQDGKTKTNQKGRASKRSAGPCVRYTANATGISLSLPQGYQFPLSTQHAKPPEDAILCGVEGCKNPKKYSCSYTKVALCSLECYKTNKALSEVTGTWKVMKEKGPSC